MTTIQRVAGANRVNEVVQARGRQKSGGPGTDKLSVCVWEKGSVEGPRGDRGNSKTGQRKTGGVVRGYRHQVKRVFLKKRSEFCRFYCMIIFLFGT